MRLTIFGYKEGFSKENLNDLLDIYKVLFKDKCYLDLLTQGTLIIEGDLQYIVVAINEFEIFKQEFENNI